MNRKRGNYFEKNRFYYDLPEELIAQEPLKDRSSSRLMILDKNTGEIEHKHFYDIVDELNEGDALILNDTKVLPARLYGQKEDTGGAIEFCFCISIRLILGK